MSNIDTIRYADLSRLRLKDFLAGAGDIWIEESGMQVAVGLGGFERFGETSFAWKQGEPYRTAEVTVDLSPDSILPDRVAKAIIERLGLPLYKGMSASELMQALGTPETDEASGSRRFLRFVCGDRDPYRLGCAVHDQHGLIYFVLARKDYCDQNESL